MVNGREISDDDPLGHAFTDSLQHLACLLHRALGQDDDELLAPVAARDVDGPEGVPKHLREGPQRAIAGGVPEDVVQILEVVEVAVGHRIGRARVAAASRTAVSKLLRVMRPVRESLLAWVWETSKARSIARRSDCPSCDHLDVLLHASEGGEPSSVVTWKTPIALPLMLTGTHSAEHCSAAKVRTGIERRAGREHHVRVLDAAGQSCGDMTPHPTSSACAELTSTCRKWALLESARSSSDRISGAASLRASATRSKRDGSASRHLQRALQTGLERDPPGKIRIARPHGLDCSRSTRRAWLVRTAITMPAKATPMTMDHRSSIRARLAAACAWSARCRRDGW